MKFSLISTGALSAFALVTLGLPPAHAIALDARVEKIIAQSGQALGVAAIQSVQILRTDARVSSLSLHGTSTQYASLRDGRFSEIVDLTPLVQLDGYDGQVIWSGDGSHLVWESGGDSDRSTEINQAYIASYGLWRPQASGAVVAWLGTRSEKGVGYDVLSILPSGSKSPFEMWLRKKTHLPDRVNLTNGFLTSTTTFSDYRTVHGLAIAYNTHVESSDGNNVDTTITHISFLPAGAGAPLSRPKTHPTDFSIEDGATSTTIPIALGENHVSIDVKINGKGPYHFLFDTGGANVIDPDVAAEVGAAGRGSAQGSGVGSQTESFSFANVSQLQIGEALVKDQLFAVIPTRQGFGVSAGRPVDGLIGWEVLARFVTTFDYANDRVTLALPGTINAPEGAHIVPFVLYGTQPQIACTIDGIPAECTIDTGARDTLSFMTPFLAAHPQIVPSTTTAAGVEGFGLGGPAIGKLGRIADVGIDDLHLKDLIADYSLQQKGALTAPFVAANLGGNLLRRFTITFDYGKQTMALVPNAAFAEADVYERSGLFLIRRGGKILVIDARPGTPAADAGIVKGDAIDRIDDASTSTMSLAQIRAVFTKPAGTTVQLDLIGADGGRRSVSITLRNYV